MYMYIYMCMQIPRRKKLKAPFVLTASFIPDKICFPLVSFMLFKKKNYKVPIKQKEQRKI